MTYDDFLSLCTQRRSIRSFSDQPVTKDEILQLLELARLAPSIENLQPWHFHVITDKKLQEQLMGASCYGNFVSGAGAFIVVTADRSLQTKAKDVVWNPHELEYSCMAAMTHLLLGATSLRLGSCWVSLHHGAAYEALQLPTHMAVVGGLMIGHYRKGEEKASGTHERRPLQDIYTLHA